MTILMSDSNGRSIPALTPQSTVSVALVARGGLVLAANDEYRYVEILTTDATDCKLAVGESTTATHYPLMQNERRGIKLEPNTNLYASGSGNLFVMVLG